MKILKADPFVPSVIVDDIIISTMPIANLRALAPEVRRAKTEEMRNRVIYFVDEGHEVVVIVAVLPRKIAYDRRERVVSEMRYYYENKGWEYAYH
jgi:hypothetical protein